MTLSLIISKRIRELLAVKSLTRYTLACRAGIPCSTLYYALRGDSKNIKSTTLINICRGFNISIAEFFNDKIFALENIDDN